MRNKNLKLTRTEKNYGAICEFCRLHAEKKQNAIEQLTWMSDRTESPGLQERIALDYYDFAVCKHSISNSRVCTWMQVHDARREEKMSAKTTSASVYNLLKEVSGTKRTSTEDIARVTPKSLRA